MITYVKKFILTNTNKLYKGILQAVFNTKKVK